MYDKFYNCPNLTNIDLSSFDIKNITNMFDMFNSCSKLYIVRMNNCSNMNLYNKLMTYKIILIDYLGNNIINNINNYMNNNKE